MAGGACFWALYLVTYKKFVGDPSHTTINVQSTLVGLISVFFSWPVLFILHYTGAEKFELPSGTIAERRPSALDHGLIASIQAACRSASWWPPPSWCSATTTCSPLVSRSPRRALSPSVLRPILLSAQSGRPHLITIQLGGAR